MASGVVAVLPCGEQVRAWVPQLVATGVAAVPAEPPRPHGGRDAGHIGAHRHLIAAVFDNPEAVLGLLVPLVGDGRGVVECQQCHPALQAVLKCLDDMCWERGHFG